MKATQRIERVRELSGLGFDPLMVEKLESLTDGGLDLIIELLEAAAKKGEAAAKTEAALDLSVYLRTAIEERGLVVPALPHRAALAQQVTELTARVDELLAHNTKLREEKRAVDRRAQVEQFHRAFNQPILERPTVPTPERMRHRLRLIAEEFLETVEASLDVKGYTFRIGGDPLEGARVQLRVLIDQAPVAVDLPEFIDGLADLDYVIEGSRLELGVDGGPIAAEVHRANMSKLGPDGKPIMDGHKVIKPPGFTPPDIAGKLREQGWEG